MTVRYRIPDRKNAESILKSAKKDMDYTLSIIPGKDSATTIIRNIYGNFRMLGDALLVSKGIESEDHVAPIKELLKLKVKTKRPINLIDNLRRLRHNINYYGYTPNMLEVKDTMEIAKCCFYPLYEKVKNKVIRTN